MADKDVSKKKKYLSMGGLADVWVVLKKRLSVLTKKIDDHISSADNRLSECMTQIARNRYHVRLLAGGADAEEFDRMADLSNASLGSSSPTYNALSDKIVYDTSRKQFVLERTSMSVTSDTSVTYYISFMNPPISMGEFDEGVAMGFAPRKHVIYLDAATGRSYRWNGSDLTEYALYNNRGVTCDPMVASDANECKGKSAGVRTYMTDSTTANMPASDSKYGSIMATTISSVHHIQVFTSFSASTECWTRRCINGTWGEWKKKY